MGAKPPSPPPPRTVPWSHPPSAKSLCSVEAVEPKTDKDAFVQIRPAKAVKAEPKPKSCDGLKSVAAPSVVCKPLLVLQEKEKETNPNINMNKSPKKSKQMKAQIKTSK